MNEETKIDHKNNSIVEKLSTHNNSDLDYIYKSHAGNKSFLNSSNCNNNFNENIPKSFIDTKAKTNDILEEQPILIPKQFSSSFVNQAKYRNNVQFDYMTNIKYCVKNKVIPEKESRAEESHNFTINKRETQENMNINTVTGTMNNTLIFNSIDNENYIVDSNSTRNQKVLIKHSLKKTRSPRFLKTQKKKINNTDIYDKKDSFICNSKEIFEKISSFVWRCL